MERVTKSWFVERLVEEGFTRKQASKAYDAVLAGITKALARGDRVTLRGFGRFDTHRRPFYWCQVPGDREIVRVPERIRVTFKPGSSMTHAADESPDDPYFDALIARRHRITKELLSQPQLNPRNHDTQFDIGIAYREMGLSERALPRFQTALDLLDARERGARYVRCCYMLGLCYEDLGEFDLSAVWFRNGLDAPRRPLAERLELHYRLGLLLIKDRRIDEALSELEQISAINPNFRDVPAYIRTLEELQMGHRIEP